MKRLVSILATLVVVALATTACATLPSEPGSPSPSPTAEQTPSTTTPDHRLVPPNATADGAGISPYEAKDGAPTVEVFFDYQCPACANFEAAFASELSRLAQAGEIKLVYRTMLFLDLSHGNDASTRAGVAAACADVAGKYDAYHTTLFQMLRSGYPDSVLTTTVPGRIGLTGAELESFQKCYTERRTLNFVRSAGEAAINAGVNATPTIRVNDKPLDLTTLDFQNPASIKQAIDAAAKVA